LKEDIKILKDKECMWKYPEVRILEAQENVLNRLQDLEQIEAEHKKINGELQEKIKKLEDINRAYRNQLNSAFDRGFIHKSKIREKLEELDKEEQEAQDSISEEEREEYSDASIGYLLMDIEARRSVLQDLLEENK